MVSGNCEIIVYRIHKLNDGSALIRCAKGGSLKMIAGVNKQYIAVFLLQLLLYCADCIVA